MGNKGSKTSSTGPSAAEIATLKANSKLSEQEIRQMYEEFQNGGGSSQGTITKEEFRSYYKQVVGSADKEGILADNTFAAFDTNHDGSINFSEFVLSVVAQNKTDLDSALNFSFEVLDTSGDGQISLDELANYVEKATILTYGKKGASKIDSKAVAQSMFQQFGLNHTQKLNKKQFIEGCKENQELASMFGPPE